MADKSNKNEEAEIPPAIIAQAEAAIFGNFESETSAAAPRRRPSRARSEFHHYQNDISGSDGAALKK